MSQALEPRTKTAGTPRVGGRRLGPRSAFALQVSMLVLFLAAASAPTPLYAVYQAEWGFSAVTVTVVFGVYALAVLLALLTVGSLSDHIGRRPVLIAAIGLQAVALIVFATAEGVPALLTARVAQGLSTGAAVGALGAGLLDLSRTRGTIANGVGSIAGTAVGAIGSGLLVQFLPAPTHLIYLTLLGILVLQAIGVALMPESSARVAGALASLRPQLGLPHSARRPLLLAVPALIAVWSMAGFYGSLGPSLVRSIVGSNAVALGGLGLFVLAASGALTVAFVQGAQPRTVVVFGTSALISGVGLTLLAITARSTVGFVGATAIAGVGFGAAFQGSLRSVLPFAATHQRAGVLSTIYVVCYLALGLPSVVAGFVVVDGAGVLSTARGYGVVVMALAGLALVGALARRDVPTAGIEPAPAPVGRPAFAETDTVCGQAG